MVLSQKTIDIVKSCVPLLESGGEALTKHFYSIMLTEFPEVVPFFNKTHQVNGDQPRALARAVLGYAKHIDKLEAISGVATQIINKHVSLSVKPEHYPIVGKCLLRAIREVLGEEVATDEVINAWGEAYQQLANILIAAEESVYHANEIKTGGWRNEREFILTRKVIESTNGEIASFYLTPKDGKPVMNYEAGQYLGLMIKLINEEGKEQMYRRNYSLSSSPHSDCYRITVKHEPNGLVSSFLHKKMKVGDCLFCYPPVGEFIYHPVKPFIENTNIEKPLVLLAGGIGVTPLLPIAEKALKESHRHVVWIHSCRNSGYDVFNEELKILQKQYPQRLTIHHHYTCSSTVTHFSPYNGKRLNRFSLASFLPRSPALGGFHLNDIDVYFLGPKPFMKDMKKYLLELNIPSNQLYWEFFGPATDI
jgi:nitric oxide dioxygenase